MNGPQATSPSAVWDRVVCGIDLSPAARQVALVAARFMPASARLTLCHVISRADVQAGAFLDETFLHEEFQSTLADEGASRLREVRREIGRYHPAELHLHEGQVLTSLLGEVQAERATLVAIGSHGHSRAAGIVLGSVATAMLHSAPASVLIAHGAETPDAGDIIVGFDGSGDSARALAAGQELAERRGLTLRVITATGDPHPPGPASSSGVSGPGLPAIEKDPRGAVDALVDASTSAGLVVLGSRHLSGVRSLSSVSERVAHHARCPVLVVR